MQETNVTLINPSGLHARPAAIFAKTAGEFKETSIKAIHESRSVDAKSIISVMSLGAKQGSTITLHAEGPQEEEAVSVLSALITSGFGEVG